MQNSCLELFLDIRIISFLVPTLKSLFFESNRMVLFLLNFMIIDLARKKKVLQKRLQITNHKKRYKRARKCLIKLKVEMQSEKKNLPKTCSYP